MWVGLVGAYADVYVFRTQLLAAPHISSQDPIVYDTTMYHIRTRMTIFTTCEAEVSSFRARRCTQTHIFSIRMWAMASISLFHVYGGTLVIGSTRDRDLNLLRDLGLELGCQFGL